MSGFSINFKLLSILGLALISVVDFNAGLMAQEKSKEKASKDSTVSTLQITSPVPLPQNKSDLQTQSLQAPSPAKLDSAVTLEIKIDTVAPSVNKPVSSPPLEVKLDSLPQAGAMKKDTPSATEVIELKIAPVKTPDNTQKKSDKPEKQ